jgi:hypothetical protein
METLPEHVTADVSFVDVKDSNGKPLDIGARYMFDTFLAPGLLLLGTYNDGATVALSFEDGQYEVLNKVGDKWTTSMQFKRTFTKGGSRRTRARKQKKKLRKSRRK